MYIQLSKTRYDGKAIVLYEKGAETELSGNEVYNTNHPMLPVKNMLCWKCHCKKILIQFSFHRKSEACSDFQHAT
jgi:hypothetical protein